MANKTLMPDISFACNIAEQKKPSGYFIYIYEFQQNYAEPYTTDINKCLITLSVVLNKESKIVEKRRLFNIFL